MTPGLMPTGRSVVDVLNDDHVHIDAIRAELAEPTASAARRRRTAHVLAATVARHLSAEEQYVYPAVRRLVPHGDDLADQEIAADAALLRDLGTLCATPPTDSRFAELATRISAELRRHARISADGVLPHLRSSAGPADLVRLGNRVAMAEEAAPTRPHPGTPATPPWNKIVDPAIGVVDRIRDVLTGRPTRVQDLDQSAVSESAPPGI